MMAYTVFSTAEWLNSDLFSALANNAMSCPAWLRIAAIANFNASVSSLNGILSPITSNEALVILNC